MGLDYSAEAGEKKSTASKTQSDKDKDENLSGQESEEAAETNANGNQEEEEKKEEKETKEGDEKKEVEEEKKEVKEEGDNLKTHFEKNPDKKSLTGKENLKVGEGDFTEGDDGKVTIHAKHLMDDVRNMMENPQLFFKIRKANPRKAELFTRWMGMKRSDGSADVDRMASVLNAFQLADTAEEEHNIIDENFPLWLSDSKEMSPISFEEKAGKKEEKEISKEVPYVLTELSDAIDAYVKSYDKTKGEGQPNITSDEVWENAKFLAALKANTHNPSGGKLRTPAEIIKIAVAKAFDVEAKEAVITQGNRKKTEKIEENNKGVSRKVNGPEGWYPKSNS